MSALARYFNSTGKKVYGYDRSLSPLTEKMQAEGIEIGYDDIVDYIPKQIVCNITASLIIYTPAIPENNTILQYFRVQNFNVYKRAEILGFITENYLTVAIAGTHGKTSVSTMAAYILQKSTLGCYAFLGGISKNSGSNLMLPTNSKDHAFAVVEADEFDRSFLYLQPNIALVTSIDADHLDIYKDKDDLVNSFRQFVKNIKQDGMLICKNNIPLQVENTIIKRTYSLEEPADYHALNLKKNANGTYRFDLKTPEKIIFGLETGVRGKINAENAVAAVVIASLAAVPDDIIRKRLKLCAGVKRRFDFQINNENFVYIDDYAHHPAELRAFISSVKELFAGKKITGVFQPHLYTRTRDFAADFAQSLDALDELFLLDIYPARENPIKGVSSKIIFDKLKLEKKTICKKEELIPYLKKSKPEVLLTMGAGDIDRLVEPIKNEFS